MSEVALQYIRFFSISHFLFVAFIMTKSSFEAPNIHGFLPILLYQNVFVEKDLFSLILTGINLFSFLTVKEEKWVWGVDREREILNQEHLS